MACFVDLPTAIYKSSYVNVEQIQIVREAMPYEADGKAGPLTTIILQNELKVYVKGYVTAIMKQLKECSIPPTTISSDDKATDKKHSKDD